MKRNLIGLLLTLLCMVSCSDDEQNVAFSVSRVEVEGKRNSFQVDVIANCEWKAFSSSSEHVSLSHTYGQHEGTISVIVEENQYYEPQEYTIELRSIDETAIDVLTIVQAERKGIVSTGSHTIAGEGGEFLHKIHTNIDNLEIRTPDWITLVSTRGALAEYIYTFQAEPNKTGSERSGYIVWEGEEVSESVHVIQQAYSPTEVDLHIPDTLIVSETLYRFPITIKPEYADASLLHVVSTDDIAKIENGELVIDASKVGDYEISIDARGTFLYTHKLVVAPSGVSLNLKDGSTYCVGDTISIETGLPSKYSSIHISDETVLQVVSDGTYVFLKEGSVTITATNIATNETIQAAVMVTKLTVTSLGVMSMSQLGNIYSVSLGYLVKGYNLTSYTVYLTHKDNPNIRLGEMTGDNETEGLFATGIKVSLTFIASNLGEKLKEYTMHVVAIVDGEEQHATCVH